MEQEQLMKLEEKIDLLQKEVADLRKRLDNFSHLPRDKPLSINEAAAYLHLSVSRIYGLTYSGELTPVQRNKKGRILFTKDELNRFMKIK